MVCGHAADLRSSIGNPDCTNLVSAALSSGRRACLRVTVGKSLKKSGVPKKNTANCMNKHAMLSLYRNNNESKGLEEGVATRTR